MIDLRPAEGPRLTLELSVHDNRLEIRADSAFGQDKASDIALPRLDDVLRMVSQPTYYETLGTNLFALLFPANLYGLYRTALDQARDQGKRLTLELRFDRSMAPILRYPWELLCAEGQFLLRRGTVNLVRYLTFPEPLRSVKTREPIELLVISAHPKDRPPLISEFTLLEKQFQPLITADKLDLAFLTPPTWDELREWLQGLDTPDELSILHFEGHGSYTTTGVLVFENEDGESDPVEASLLADMLFSTNLRLAVLSACESAKVAGESLLGSVAASLVLGGIPAVVAMQQTIPDDIASRFSYGFYNALLKGLDIESAVAAGRQEMLRSTCWHIPALYLRAGKAPEVTSTTIKGRIDTAGPKSAPVNIPVLFGLWIRGVDSPKPTPEELRRLLNLEPEEEVTEASTRASFQFPVEAGQLRSGVVEVRLIAEGCIIAGGDIRLLTLVPDFDMPPVWFCFTPRRPGRQPVIFELRQNGAVVASIAHMLTVTEQREGPAVAAIQSQPTTVDTEAKPGFFDVITSPPPPPSQSAGVKPQAPRPAGPPPQAAKPEAPRPPSDLAGVPTPAEQPTFGEREKAVRGGDDEEPRGRRQRTARDEAEVEEKQARPEEEHLQPEIAGRMGGALDILDLALFDNTRRSLSAIQDPQHALEVYDQALRRQRESGNRAQQASILNNMGNLFRTMNNLVGAFQSYNQALRIVRDLEDRVGESVVLYNLSLLYIQQGETESALNTLQQALDLFREVRASAQTAATMITMALVLYYHAGQRSEAVHLVRQAHTLLRQANLQRDAAGHGTVFYDSLLAEMGENK